MRILNLYRFLFASSLLIFASCEDVVEVEVKNTDPQLCIDAILTNEHKPQIVKISQSIAYFDNNGNYPAFAVDSVIMTDNYGKRFVFDLAQAGTYVYTPDGIDTFVNNAHFVLNVYKGATVYSAQSTMMRSPAVDSITYKYNENRKGYFVTMHARDLQGPGDYYWIRTYRNGVFLNNPSKINISYDAGFEQAFSDSQEFLFPISIMGTNDFEKSYQIGEKVKIEILGISGDFHLYLGMAQQQMQNGGMFAPPPVNVRTNFKQNDPNAMPVVGFFNVCELHSIEVEIKE